MHRVSESMTAFLRELADLQEKYFVEITTYAFYDKNGMFGYWTALSSFDTDGEVVLLPFPSGEGDAARVAANEFRIILDDGKSPVDEDGIHIGFGRAICVDVNTGEIVDEHDIDEAYRKAAAKDES